MKYPPMARQHKARLLNRDFRHNIVPPTDKGKVKSKIYKSFENLFKILPNITLSKNSLRGANIKFKHIFLCILFDALKEQKQTYKVLIAKIIQNMAETPEYNLI